MLQTIGSIWGDLAFQVYGYRTLKYRQRIYAQWKRHDGKGGSNLRRLVMAKLAAVEDVKAKSHGRRPKVRHM